MSEGHPRERLVEVTWARGVTWRAEEERGEHIIEAENGTC